MTKLRESMPQRSSLTTAMPWPNRPWPSWWPQPLKVWFRLRELRRDLRNLDEHFGPWVAGAQGDRKQAILAEWLLEAARPEREIAQLESDKVRRQARFWNVVVPPSVHDTDTGRRYIPDDLRQQLRRDITATRRESVKWWIQLVVIPLIALASTATALVLLVYVLSLVQP